VIAVVLAGGVGKRLGDISRRISKGMLPILGVPITARIIGQVLKETPIRRFVIVVGKPDQDIACFLRENPPGGAEIELVVQAAPLGMADALEKAVEQVGIESDFLVAACDNLFEPGAVSALYRKHCEADFDGTMCLLRARREDIAEKSAAVHLDSGLVSRIVEKPSIHEIGTEFASIPLYIFSPKLTQYLPLVKPSKRGEYELQDAIQMLIDDGGKIGYTEIGWRRTVTSPEDLLSVNLEMLRKRRTDERLDIPGLEIEQPVLVEKECVLLEGSHIGPCVYIGGGCTIGRGCRLSNCVVLPGTTVPDATRADDKILG